MIVVEIKLQILATQAGERCQKVLSMELMEEYFTMSLPDSASVELTGATPLTTGHLNGNTITLGLCYYGGGPTRVDYSK